MVWVGDYEAEYKASPEAQRLVGWASAQVSHSMQQAGSRHVGSPRSLQPTKGMHTYMRQDAGGSSIVVFDVSFPPALADSLEDVQADSSSSQQSSWSNASAAVGSSVVMPERKYHPANAAVADWQTSLDAICHSECRLAASGPGRVTVTAPASIAEVLHSLHHLIALTACCAYSRQHFRFNLNMAHCTCLHLLACITAKQCSIPGDLALMLHRVASPAMCLTHQVHADISVGRSRWNSLKCSGGLAIRLARHQYMWSLQQLAIQGVVNWLKAQPQVHWVSPRPKTRAANFFATGIGQCGNAATLAAASNGPGAANDAGTHPLWDAGEAPPPFSSSGMFKQPDLVVHDVVQCQLCGLTALVAG